MTGMNIRQVIVNGHSVDGYVVSECGKVFTTLKHAGIKGVRGGSRSVVVPFDEYHKRLKPYVDEDRYNRVFVDGMKRGIHRLVCEAFHGKPDAGMHAGHKDDDVSNNAAGNLSWVTSAENNRQMKAHGRAPDLSGMNNGRAVLTPSIVRRIRADARSQAKIAESHGIARTTVSAIKRRVIWKEVD